MSNWIAPAGDTTRCVIEAKKDGGPPCTAGFGQHHSSDRPQSPSVPGVAVLYGLRSASLICRSLMSFHENPPPQLVVPGEHGKREYDGIGYTAAAWSEPRQNTIARQAQARANRAACRLSRASQRNPVIPTSPPWRERELLRVPPTS